MPQDERRCIFLKNHYNHYLYFSLLIKLKLIIIITTINLNLYKNIVRILKLEFLLIHYCRFRICLKEYFVIIFDIEEKKWEFYFISFSYLDYLISSTTYNHYQYLLFSENLVLINLEEKNPRNCKSKIMFLY